MYDEGKKLVGYKYLDTDFVKPNKECTNCDSTSDMGYVCFDCERGQVKDEYPTSKYTDDCEWVIPKRKVILMI